MTLIKESCTTTTLWIDNMDVLIVCACVFKNYFWREEHVLLHLCGQGSQIVATDRPHQQVFLVHLWACVCVCVFDELWLICCLVELHCTSF